MRLIKSILALVALLGTGALTSFAQESHVAGMTGLAKVGKENYKRYCIGCHGPAGDGAGENAAWIDPKPLDFTTATFKCRSTPTGTLPTDEDMFEAITRGFVDTNMPSWKPLTDQNRTDLVAYIKTFSPRWQSESGGTPITIPPEPSVTIESIIHGRDMFQKMECWKCHGPEGHGNGPAAATLTDSKDNPIRPYNFAMGSRFKCGVTNQDLYRIFMTGLDGTPMPSFADVIKPEEAWDLVHFLRTLQPTPSKESAVWKNWLATEPSHAKQLKPIGPDQGTLQGDLN
jgi:cytochrome c oxidase cbb3-type subunit I/II